MPLLPRYSLEALRILSFLTQRGIVNTGILPLTVNPDLLIITPQRKPSVAIVGAGIAGLAAARQLTMFGLVTRDLGSYQSYEMGIVK